MGKTDKSSLLLFIYTTSCISFVCLVRVNVNRGLFKKRFIERQRETYQRSCFVCVTYVREEENHSDGAIYEAELSNSRVP